MYIPLLQWARKQKPPMRPARVRQLRLEGRIKGIRKKRSRYFVPEKTPDPRGIRGYWGQLRNLRRRPSTSLRPGKKKA